MLTIRLFGHARFETDDGVRPFRAPPKAVALIAYLATHHDAPVSRGFLAELLWPDGEPDEGRTNVRRHLHVIANALPRAPNDAPYVVGTMQTLRWNGAAAATVDAIAFARAGAAGRIDEAIAWYGGDFLETHHDEWVLAERERLRALQLEYLRTSLQRKRGERDLRGALADVRRIFAIDPWREDALRAEMTVRAQLGDRGGALAAYRSFAERLRVELDVEPAPDTRAVYDALARGDVPVPGGAGPPLALAAAVPAALPFAGRTAEFDTLARAWMDAARGAGGTILIGGEAGAGKSRLAAELGLHVEMQGGGVLLGTTVAGEVRPYEPVVDALRGAAPLVASATAPADLAVLARLVPDLALGGVVEAPARVPEAERARLFAAFFSAIASLAKRRPHLLVLEDLHWASASSIALVEYLARRLAGVPVLVVGTYREEEAAFAHPVRGMRRRLERDAVLRAIPLARFDFEAVRDVAARVRPECDDLDALAREWYAYSEGVPLFLEEAVRAPERNPAAFRLNVPARVQRLGEEAGVVLEIAATAGTAFNVDVLCEVSGWNEADVLRALDELVDGRFVRESKRRRFGDYSFSHHLVHAAVYAGVPEATRRRRHARLARVLAAIGEGRPDAAGEVARHFEAGGEPAEAARRYAVAARYAREVYANDEALAHAERAIALASDTDLLVEMQVVRGWAGNAIGARAVRTGAVEALARLTPAARHLPDVERLRTMHAMFEGRFDDARAAADRYVVAARAIDDPGAIAAAHVEGATIAIASDRYDDAEAHLGLAAAALPEHDETGRLRLLRARTFLAQRRGAHDRELQVAAAALLAEARRLGDPQAEAEAHVRYAHVDIAAHRFGAARDHLDRAVDAYRRFGSPRGIDSVRNNAANLALWVAEYDRAQDLYATCFAFAEDNGDEVNQFGCAIGMTLACAYRRDFPAAAAHLARVAHLARDDGRMEVANWQLCRGMIAAETGNAADAAAAFDASLAIHRAKAPTALFALTLAFAGHAALDAGDVARARTVATELGALDDELQSGEEFPHLMFWLRARVAELDADAAAAAAFRRRAARLYDARAEAVGAGATAFATVPWNARFLAVRSDAFPTVAS